MPSCQNPCSATLASPDFPRAWFGGEYLLWWVKPGPLSTPLVTTGAPGTNLSGAIGQPDTAVLFGGSSQDFGTFSGMRLTLGGWLDSSGTLGIETQGFLLENRSAGFSAGSNQLGSPPLYLPAFNVDLQQERALVVSDPVGQLGGNVDISLRTQLWGAEVSGLMNLVRNDSGSLDLLAGFRYLDLDEDLQLDNTTTDLVLDVVDMLRDRFQTRNQFYGGQLGARASLGRGSWLIRLTSKVALGSSQQSVNISGHITETGALAGSPGTFPGGFYTQPSNIGRRTSHSFAVVPEVDLKIGYEFLPGISTLVGYNFLYWNNVVRPGDQFDRGLDLSQSPVLNLGTPGPATRPTSQFNTTDFWAHGVSFMLLIAY